MRLGYLRPLSCYLASTISAMYKRTWDEAFRCVPPSYFVSTVTHHHVQSFPTKHLNRTTAQPSRHLPHLVQLQHGPATIMLAQPISVIHSRRLSLPSGAAFSGMSPGSSRT